jgi:PleD family two-component response regulator
MSIGAMTIRGWDKSMPIEPYLKQVDAALYRAKAEGRNCVVCVEQLVAV